MQYYGGFLSLPYGGMGGIFSGIHHHIIIIIIININVLVIINEITCIISLTWSGCAWKGVQVGRSGSYN